MDRVAFAVKRCGISEPLRSFNCFSVQVLAYNQKSPDQTTHLTLPLVDREVRSHGVRNRAVRYRTMLDVRLGHVTFRYLVCFKWMRSNVPALLFSALSSTRRIGLVWYFARNPNSEPANNR